MRRRPLHRRAGKFLFAVAAIVLATAPLQAADRWELAASDWSRPRSGMSVLEMTPVAEAVRAWQAAYDDGADAHLLLVHPGGEEGSLWAAELRDWLVALGVPPRVIELLPGRGAADHLEIRLLRQDG